MLNANKFGRYEVLREIGRGGTGVEYEARDSLGGAVVALQTINLGRGNETPPSLEAVFLKDVLSARRLSHPSIVAIYAAGHTNGTVYVATERPKGDSLQTLLNARRSLPLARSVALGAEIASALAYAHEQGVAHHALRPSSIIVSDDAAKITHFGLARIGNAAIGARNDVSALRYLSPEQVRGDDTIDARADIFALGAILYEMLAGRPAFDGGSPAEITEQILKTEPPLPSELNPEVPPEMDGTVLSMLAKHPDDRIPNAHVVLRRLADKLHPEPAKRGVEPPKRSPEPAQRSAEPAKRKVADDVPRADTIPSLDPRLFEPLVLPPEPPEPPPRATQRPRGIYATVAVVIVALGFAVSWLQLRNANKPDVTVAEVNPEPVMPQPPPAVATGPIVTAEEEPRVSDVADLPVAPDDIQRDDKPPVAPPSSAKIAPSPDLTRTEEARKQPLNKPRLHPATLVFDVSPRGEIYIDGQLRGTTPPISTLDLPPGVYRIEVRSASHTPYLTYITVQPGDVRRIRHEFRQRTPTAQIETLISPN